MNNLLLLAFLVLSLAACQSQSNNTSTSADSEANKNISEPRNGNFYNCPEIGWEMEIPKDWQVIAKDEIAPPDPNNVSESALVLKRLLSLEKDQDNQFHATIEEYTAEKQKDWSGINQTVKSMVFAQISRDEEIKADSTETSVIEIQGQKFETFKLTISRASGELLLYQRMYFALINNFNFNAFLISNSIENDEFLVDHFKSSRFFEPIPFESIERPSPPEIKKHSPYRDSIQAILDVITVNHNTNAELTKDEKNYLYYKLENGLELLSVKWSVDRNQYEESFAILNGNLVYAFELQDYYKSQTDIGQSWNCRYFIKEQQIVEHETLGTGKSNEETWQPESIFNIWNSHLPTFKELQAQSK